MDGVGRVFCWPPEASTLEEIAFQPLENHRANVEALLREWKSEGALGMDKCTREHLLEAVRHHDWGKKTTFRILPPDLSNPNPRRRRKDWGYTFSGHRFRLPDALTGSYARAIERSHHDFSTPEIARTVYRLVEHDGNQTGLAPEIVRERFSKDLYIYEMCDQIEAELSNWAWKGEARDAAFLSFTVQPAEDNAGEAIGPFPYGEAAVFHIDPFPFDKEEVSLTFQFRCYKLDKALSARELERLPQSEEEFSEIKVTVCLRPILRERDSEAQKDVNAVYRRAIGHPPNSMQDEIWRHIQDGNDALVLQAATGTGKTEAATLPLLLAHNKRVMLVLPAKALLEDHLKRFDEIFGKLATENRPYRLIVDTGDHTESHLYRGAAEPEVLYGRHLYRGDLILTTLDKMLYRYFGYDPTRKSYTYPLRLGQEQTAFVFDEAHTYEGTAFTNFASLLKTLYLRGYPLVLMTATLPKSYFEALGKGFTHVDYTTKEKAIGLEQQMGRGTYAGQRTLKHLPEVADVPQESDDWEVRSAAFETHKRARRGALLGALHQVWIGEERVILTTDRVKDAAELYRKLKAEPLPGLAVLQNENPTAEDLSSVNLFLYHGRLAPAWRRKVYQRLRELDKAGHPYLLVSTSAIEVGVDLNATHLITELCSPEALVQRAGRVNRRGDVQDAQVWVLGDTIPSYLNPFQDDVKAFNEYRKKLGATINLDADAARDLMSVYEKPILKDPRAETAFDLLSRYVYEYQLEYEPLHELGFIATRSWEPTLTVKIGRDSQEEKTDEIDVPVLRLSRGPDDAQEVELQVYRRHYDEDKSFQGKWEEAVFGGDLYRGRYRIVLSEEFAKTYRRDEGLVEMPKVFKRMRWSNDSPLRVRLYTWRYEKKQKEDTNVFYFSEGTFNKEKPSSRIILTYLADPGLEIT